MFNVTIIDVKKTVLKLAVLIVIMITLFWITQEINKIKTSQVLQVDVSEKLVECLSNDIPAMTSFNYKFADVLKEDGKEEKTFPEKILNMELARVLPEEDHIDEQQIKKDQEIVDENDDNENNATPKSDEQISAVATAETNVKTEIVTQNPIAENCNVELCGVKIKNETGFGIDETVLNTELNINKDNILIFHTHTCESYTPTDQYNYQQTGNFRTTDLNFSVARVGDELTNYLMGYGFNVIHDKTYHDYPAYTGSYTRSKTTVENILKTNPTDIIIDLHRDAIGSKSNYDPSVKIGDEVAAQLMFVIGTNGGGLYHPNWQSNLKFAIEIQQKANEMYPGLFKTMIVRNSRYNQHLGKAATIIEVGSTGNTLEQCMTSMKYLSKILDEYRK